MHVLPFQMASGFECDFVENPPKAFQSECPICLLVLRDPYQVKCCGKSFCKECIHRIKAANQVCPTCNDKNFTWFRNKGLQRALYSFLVYCVNKNKGCGWTGELRELDNHLNACPLTLIQCPLGCADCKSGVPRKDVKSHISDNLLSGMVTVIQMAMESYVQQRFQECHDSLTQLKHEIKRNKQAQHVSKLKTIFIFAVLWFFGFLFPFCFIFIQDIAPPTYSFTFYLFLFLPFLYSSYHIINH